MMYVPGGDHRLAAHTARAPAAIGAIGAARARAERAALQRGQSCLRPFCQLACVVESHIGRFDVWCVVRIA